MNTEKIKIGVPKQLLEYAKKLSEHMDLARELEKEAPGCVRQMSHQYDNGLDDFLLSKGLGFDRGYNDCRDHHLLRWIELATIHCSYFQYEEDLLTHSKNAIKWSDWRKSIICELSIWDDYLKDMLKTISVPDKDAFLQGWCDGVSKFFLSICCLIECPPDFLPGKIPQ
jgi:hypothetical protein